jgi:hypothetical protein
MSTGTYATLALGGRLRGIDANHRYSCDSGQGREATTPSSEPVFLALVGVTLDLIDPLDSICSLSFPSRGMLRQPRENQSKGVVNGLIPKEMPTRAAVSSVCVVTCTDTKSFS